MTTSTAKACDVSAHARRLQSVALDELTAAAGNESLCTLSRGGAPHPAVKYHEGAVAALAQGRRAVDALDPEADAANTIVAQRDRWVAQGRPYATPSWRAYLDGGLDALDSLLETPSDDSRIDLLAGTTTVPEGVAEALALAPSTADTRRISGLARRARSRWPRRRSIATLVLAPLLFVAFVSGAADWTPHAPVWTALVALSSIVGAAVLASYIPAPGQGWRPNVGCTPCAAVSAMTVLGAGTVLQSTPLEPLMALAALGMVTFGLVQRLTGAGTSCTS